MCKRTKTILSRINRNYCVLFVAIIVGTVFYSLNATRVGLWYDEAIEYFYSKVLIGSVPGGSDTVNMLERIRLTYQPPLYNVLMYCWLKVFDTEFAFRFAGIITTMIGSVGCYFALDESLNDGKWSAIGTVFYIFTPCVVFYGLECAEYNLMLSFVAWDVFFFVRTLKRKDLKSIIGFFIFACLSVYSQYGAAFIVAGMYFAILIKFIADANYREFKMMSLISIITLIAAVIPLVVFFLMPQMVQQGSVSVSHIPYFRKGFFYEFIKGGVITILSLFGNITGFAIIFFVIICCISCVLKPSKLFYPVLSFLISWVLYFFAVACNLYGYNSWKPDSVGVKNLGGRYSLFFIPEIVIILVIGMFVFVDWVKQRARKYYIPCLSVFIVGIVVCCLIETYSVGIYGWKKDDVREVVATWYDLDAYKSKTLVHQLDEAPFYYYLIHDTRYSSVDNDLIEETDSWIKDAEYNEMKEQLEKMGFLSEKEYYYIAPSSGSYDVFVSVVTDSGYSIEVVHSGMSMLLHLTK